VLPCAARGIRRHSSTCLTRSNPMLDVAMLAIGFGFFALSIAYVYACDQL
jgi:hypothetical protein